VQWGVVHAEPHGMLWEHVQGNVPDPAQPSCLILHVIVALIAVIVGVGHADTVHHLTAAAGRRAVGVMTNESTTEQLHVHSSLHHICLFIAVRQVRSDPLVGISGL